MLDILNILLGLFGLFFGGDFLVKGASRLALSFGISSLIIGLTVVSIGTSAPELLVSVSAALGGSSELALGNVIGSNIGNIGLILGVTGLIVPLTVHLSLIKRGIPIMIGIGILVFLLAQDGLINRIDGGVLFVGFMAFNALLIYENRVSPEAHPDGPNPVKVATSVESSGAIHPVRELLRLTGGIVLLVIGANLLVGGATNIARELGISELAIGLTMVAIGTSLPEFATSFIAALKKEADIAVGNIVGSNIANILLILATTALIQPIDLDPNLVRFEFLVMIGFSLLLLPFAFDRVLSRRESAIFLGSYTAFIGYTFLQGT